VLAEDQVDYTNISQGEFIGTVLFLLFGLGVGIEGSWLRGGGLTYRVGQPERGQYPGSIQ
jgi:hypothetical protein